jgi:hypothetical protein
MADECSSAQSCKEAALDRFKDAFVLYEGKRYLAVLYMSGYVIELGIKSEFHRLKDLDISKMNVGNIVKHLFSFSDSKQEQSEWIEKFALLSTLFELVNFIKNIANEDKNLDKKEGKKLLANKIESSNTFEVILSNRLLPRKKEKNSTKKEENSTKKEENSTSTFHDISGFLQTLWEWKKQVGDETFSVDDYKIDDEKGLRWSVKLRYMTNDSALSENNDEQPEETAKKALLMSIKFLKEILQVDVSKYEDKLNPINKQKSIGIEKRY